MKPGYTYYICRHFYKGDNLSDFMFPAQYRPSEKGVYFKRKDFAPRGAYSFLSEKLSFQKEGKIRLRELSPLPLKGTVYTYTAAILEGKTFVASCSRTCALSFYTKWDKLFPLR